MHGPTPWQWQEMTATVVIRDARGHTVCNLPMQSDKRRRRANAELIVRSVNPKKAPTMEEQIWKHRFVEQFVLKMTGDVDGDEALGTAYDMANVAWDNREDRDPETAADDEIDAIASSL